MSNFILGFLTGTMFGVALITMLVWTVREVRARRRDEGHRFIRTAVQIATRAHPVYRRDEP